ncbi:DUF4345 domain-containing protein [Aliikangiella marina]|nr:DUF4345 domain-containing protein [Aliikangiella marina]
MSKQKIYLAISGIILLLVGAFIGFVPAAYLGQFNLDNGVPIELFSELRGMGGSLFVFGIFIFIGAFYQQFEKYALVISALTFSAFSIFRLLGILFDGLPSEGIIVALIIEVSLALVAIYLLRQEFSANSRLSHQALNIAG